MQSKSEIYREIRQIEKEIERIKMLQRLGKMELKQAKIMIKNLDAKLMSHVNKLPEYDRQLYMIKREFGHINDIL
ncbi:MAG: hypothetical protein QXD48_01325 [Candidatus Aenigmatarchaeota archaeon]